MRERRICAVVLLLAAWATPAYGGLYNPHEPDEGPLAPRDFARFKQGLDQLRMLAWPKVPFDYPLRQRYLLAAKTDVADRTKVPKWTITERLSLSAYFLRTGNARAAQEILQSPNLDPKNFIALSNLATAYYQERPAEAIARMRRALAAWPKWGDLGHEQRELIKQLGWDEERFQHFKTSETFYLKLLQTRQSEPGRRPLDQEKVDALFGDAKEALRFVGEDGQFAPGKLAAREMKKLPGGNVYEAIAIVQQLLVWMPSDARLLWLLGELYNAAGDRVTARTIFETLAGLGSSYNYRPRELVEHRRSVAQDLEENPPKEQVAVEPKNGEPPADESAGARIDWRTLLIGFGAGVIAALFLAWQVQEIRRRRARRINIGPGADVRADTRLPIPGSHAQTRPNFPPTHSARDPEQRP